mgnify:CR=1 FL=1
MAKKSRISNRKAERLYRTTNFLASENRQQFTIHLHPALFEGLEEIAKSERKNINWIIEDMIAHSTGTTVLLKKLRGEPKPAYNDKDNRDVHKRMIDPNEVARVITFKRHKI